MEHIIYQVSKDTSSIISRIRWSTDQELYIEFRTNNKIYCYSKVPKETVIALVSSESIGKYFNKNIKKNFKYEIIEEAKV